MMKKGFTIIELAVVIGIIGILLGIVTTAAAGAVRQGRIRKAESLCTVVQAGSRRIMRRRTAGPGRSATASRATRSGRVRTTRATTTTPTRTSTSSTAARSAT